MKKVSEILKEEREKRKQSLSEVEKAIKIKQIYLEAIEDGRFHDLPSETYALGFIKNYASYLNIPISKITPMFRREYEGEKREVVPGFRKNQERFNKNSFINSKNILFLFIFVIIFAYILFQYSSIIFAPKLAISSPKNGFVSDSNVIKVTGNTDPYATVTVDGDEVYVNLDGTFKKSIYIYSGQKNISVVSKNRFGKETKQVINVSVK